MQAVQRNELYGYIHPATREWKEGLMSVTFREFSNNKTNKHQWIVLDGDIDAEWIESMNTVCTLPSSPTPDCIDVPNSQHAVPQSEVVCAKNRSETTRIEPETSPKTVKVRPRFRFQFG